MQRSPGSAPASMWRALRMLAGQRSYISLLVMNVFVGFGAACYANFAGLRLISLGGSSGQVGLAFALGALTEVPVMSLAPVSSCRASARLKTGGRRRLCGRRGE
jgi:hypothetical protein